VDGGEGARVPASSTSSSPLAIEFPNADAMPRAVRRENHP